MLHTNKIVIEPLIYEYKNADPNVPSIFVARDIVFGNDCRTIKGDLPENITFREAFFAKQIQSPYWELKIPIRRSYEYDKLLHDIKDVIYDMLKNVNYDTEFYLNNHNDGSILSSEYFEDVMEIVLMLRRYKFKKLEIIDFSSPGYNSLELSRLQKLFNIEGFCTFSFTHDTGVWEDTIVES